MKETKWTKQLSDFLVTAGKVQKDKADAVTEKLSAIVQACEGNPVQGIFDCLNENGITFDKTQLNSFFPVVIAFVNNTPHDANGGLTPEEKRVQADRHIQLEKMDKAGLPEGLTIPTEKEIAEQDAELSEYTDNTPWHTGGEAKIAKLKNQLMKYRSVLQKIPGYEDAMGHFFDQYLAALYNSDWKFTVFYPEYTLGKNLYLCLDNYGYEFVLKSYSVTTGLSEGKRYYFSLLLSLDTFYESWGPVLQYDSIGFEDFEFLAKKIAPALYANKGFSDVVKFEPAAFWTTTMLSIIPAVAHGEKIVQFYTQKGSFKDKTIPEFSTRWTHETAGKKQRWIYRNDDFFRRLCVYYNEKNGTVYLAANNKDDFEELKKKTKDFFIEDEKMEQCSMGMASFVHDIIKKEVLMLSLEKDFG
jgi:hypothetical protein